MKELNSRLKMMDLPEAKELDLEAIQEANNRKKYYEDLQVRKFHL